MMIGSATARNVVAPALLLASLLAPACQSLVWYGRGPDRGLRVAVWQRPGQQWVERDGRPDPRFRAIGHEVLAISPDGRRVAYPALRWRRWCVVVDGQPGPGFDGIGEIVWSPDGRHLAYLAQRGRRWQVVRDGRPGWTGDSIFRQTLQFSPDSRHLVLVGRDRGRTHVVVDDRPGPAWDGVAQLTLAAPARLAYVGRQGPLARVVDGERPGPAHEQVAALTLGPDGRRRAYLARQGGRWRAVIDGREGPPFEALTTPVFSPDGTSVAYAARVGSLARVVRDGVEGPAFDRVRFATLAFTRDGRLGYVVKRGAHDQFSLAGELGPAFDEVQRPVINGNGWGYLGRRGRTYSLVLNGRATTLPGWVQAAGDLQLGPDGRHHALLASGRGRAHVLSDRGLARFDLVVTGSLVLDPGGRRWGCLAGTRRPRTLFFALEGHGRVPFDPRELLSLGPGSGWRPGGSPIRAWVAAELALAARRGTTARRSIP
jgi:hypothetical protein